MQYVSTRGEAPAATLSEALSAGLAPDGGLYLPAAWPDLSLGDIPHEDLAETAAHLLAPFFEGDSLAPELGAITREAFSFPAPLVRLGEGAPSHVLELFHGPTAAFKDFGARFLAACFSRLRRGAPRPLLVLVATSGDTGGAVAAAFHKQPGIRVVVLYPKGLVSPTQEQQLTCWDGNVAAFAVRGAFDDCQRLVKNAFADSALREAFDLSSANSINIGRLLPQMTYFAQASLALWRGASARASFAIPSGNLGHGTACVWARQLGLPIEDVILAHNANRTLPDFLETGEWRPRPSVATLASAMDVGDPSNAERLRRFYPALEQFRAGVAAYAVDDADIEAGIRRGWAQYGQAWCPHTAVAAQALERHVRAHAAKRDWVLVATAHAAKFTEIVTPLIGEAPTTPPALSSLLSKARPAPEIEPTLGALRAELGL